VNPIDRILRDVETIERCLDVDDWDTLEAIGAELPEGAVDADIETLVRLRAQIEQLQDRVGIAMGAIREQLNETPITRRAAAAYLSAPRANAVIH
jgi:hypothetical protein